MGTGGAGNSYNDSSEQQYSCIPNIATVSGVNRRDQHAGALSQ